MDPRGVFIPPLSRLRKPTHFRLIHQRSAENASHGTFKKPHPHPTDGASVCLVLELVWVKGGLVHTGVFEQKGVVFYFPTDFFVL